MKEILEKRPYRSLEDLLYNGDGTWKHSKVNKTCFTALCKIEALSSLSDFTEGRITNHKQILEFLTSEGHYELLRKGRYDTSRVALKRREKTGEPLTDVMEELLKATGDVEDWSRGQKIKNYADLTSASPAHLVFPQEVMTLIDAKGVKSVLEISEGATDIGWFCAVDSIEKKTKNGKSFLKISDRKSTRLNSSHVSESRMPSSA